MFCLRLPTLLQTCHCLCKSYYYLCFTYSCNGLHVQRDMRAVHTSRVNTTEINSGLKRCIFTKKVHFYENTGVYRIFQKIENFD